jgi:hypothetical protein
MIASWKQGLLRATKTKAAVWLLLLSGFALALSSPVPGGLESFQQTHTGERLGEAFAQGTLATAEEASEPVLVEIRQAAITKVEKFISRSKKTHIRFTFKVGGKTYNGIFYEGDWNSDHLAALRSGKATLIGYWDTFMGRPSFVAKSARR